MEDWARDVTATVALKVLKRALAHGSMPPKPIRDLIERVIDRPAARQVISATGYDRRGQAGFRQEVAPSRRVTCPFYFATFSLSA
jgi:hypothetical protein